MLNAVIVDDLPAASGFLQKFCTQSGRVVVKGTFTNVPDALTYLNQEVVDLLFLDVELPGATGFELLDQLSYLPRVIMTTSKTEYAFDAFRYQVADYLKKPFTYAEFQRALEKIPEPVKTTHVGENSDEFFIKVDGQHVKLSMRELLFLESKGDYVKFVTAAKAYTSLYTLKSLEEKLAAGPFLKVHRSFIVNMTQVEKLNGNILFVQGHEVPVSKNNREEVLQRLQLL